MTLGWLPMWMINGVTVTLGLILVEYSISFMAGPGPAQAAITMAVCASLADVVTTTDRVARQVLAAALASAAAAALFYAVRPYGIVAWIPTAALIVFGAMLLLSWGPKAASVAFAANLSLVFAMSVPASQSVAWDRVAWGLVGSAGYWVWAVATGRLLQDKRRVLTMASTVEAMAALFSAIGKQLAQPGDPSWQSGIVAAEASLAERLQAARDFVFKRSEGPASSLETTALLYLIDLRDLAVASNLDAARLHVRPTASTRTSIVAQIMEAIAGELRVIAEHLRTGTAPISDPEIDKSLRDLVAELEKPGAREAGTTMLGVSDILRSKLNLLRDLQNLLRSRQLAELPCRQEDLQRYITPDEWRLAAVRANLRPEAPVFRHAIRTSVTAVSAYALACAVPWAWHPQWVLLTVVAVMQGSLAQTLLRRNARVLGTLVGCVVSALLLMSSSSAFIGLSFLVAAGVAHAFFGVRTR